MPSTVHIDYSAPNEKHENNSRRCRCILIAVGGALKAVFDGDPSTNLDIAATIAAVTAGIGLIWAKDAKEVEAPKP